MSTHIKEASLRILSEASSISGVLVFGQRGGFGLSVKCGTNDKTLVTAKGTIRIFGSLNSAMEFLRRMDVARFEVDASTYERGLLRSSRPDRAEALKRTKTRPTQSKLW